MLKVYIQNNPKYFFYNAQGKSSEVLSFKNEYISTFGD